jgi:hypothetical protein
MMSKQALENELKNLDIIHNRGKLKEQVADLIVDRPNHALDLELNYMDEIRE